MQANELRGVSLSVGINLLRRKQLFDSIYWRKNLTPRDAKGYITNQLYNLAEIYNLKFRTININLSYFYWCSRTKDETVK